MRKVIENILVVVTIIASLYVGGWLMFIHPIIELCNHYDANTLTGTIIGMTILKCVFASSVGMIIFYAGAFVNSLINKIWDKKDGEKLGSNRERN